MGSCTCEKSEGLELLPRYTTLLGASSFTTVPARLGGNKTMTVQAWRGEIQNGGTYSLYLEQSHDAEHWSSVNASAIDPGQDTVKTLQFCLTLEWFRVRVDLTGDAQVTTWVDVVRS